MKIKLIKSLGLTALLIAPFVVHGNTAEDVQGGDYNLPAYTVGEIKNLPELVYVPAPVARPSLVGTQIEIELFVNEQGMPSSVKTVKPLFSIGFDNPDKRDFAVQMTTLLNGAKFQPATDTNGNPVGVRVIMPIKVVSKEDAPGIAMSILPKKHLGSGA